MNEQCLIQKNVKIKLNNKQNVIIVKLNDSGVIWEDKCDVWEINKSEKKKSDDGKCWKTSQIKIISLWLLI